MLDVLFGNKNVERILLFLFVNGKCYGTGLHRALKTPLTPLQNALNRLEEGGVITSYYEGKTRLYQFNPAFPLLGELEQLLKKTYTLLPVHNKKVYYLAKEESSYGVTDQASKRKVVLAFWNKLGSVSELTFHAKTRSKEEKGWSGRGEGKVVINKESPQRYICQEKGTWQGKPATQLSFTNTFRWTLDLEKGVIGLEHLRRGPDHPVFLFHLTPNGKHSLVSVDSHLCAEDTYLGQIRFDRYQIRLNWRVIGPKKNEEIDYYYS